MNDEEEISALAQVMRAAKVEEGGLEGKGMLASLRWNLFGHETDEPIVVGPFRVLRKIGSGGMGVVYDAYDPRLQRHVALKVLRHAFASQVSRDFLVREARAIAKLSHPHVVVIHEVGTYDHESYIAMEFVDGCNLAQWQSQSHSTNDILLTYRQAGEGLAAAHQAGLVHGDFKPQNVLIDGSGRARVVDFGLARAIEASSNPTSAPINPRGAALLGPDRSQDQSASVPAASQITVSNVTGFGGTPAYMAPEQTAGERPTPASDQFSFCLALHEALLGYRYPADQESANQNSRRPTHQLSRGLRQVLARGLSVDPAQRWSSMRELLIELGKDHGKKRRYWIIGMVASSCIAASLVIAQSEKERQTQRCSTFRNEFSTLWNEERQQHLAQHFAAFDRPYAHSAGLQTLRRLDEYRDKWVQVREQVCEAQPSFSAAPSRLGELRIECLNQRKIEFDGLVQALGTINADGLVQVVEAASSLFPPSLCNGVQLSETNLPAIQASDRQTIEEIRKTIFRARALFRLGDFAQATKEAHLGVSMAEKVGYDPVQAEAWQVLGEIIVSADGETALSYLQKAAATALALGYDRVAAGTSSALMLELNTHGRYVEAQSWRIVAEAMVSRLERGSVEEAFLHNDLGLALARVGNYEEALGHMQKAIDLKTHLWGADSLEVAKSLSNLADINEYSGQFDDALAIYARVRSLMESNVGVDHQAMGVTIGNIGLILALEKNSDEAYRALNQSLLIFKKTVGPDHPWNGVISAGLCRIAAYAQQHIVADEVCTRAFKICNDGFGTTSPYVAEILAMQAFVDFQRDQHAAAERSIREAIRIFDLAERPGSKAGEARYIAAQILDAQLGGQREAITLATAAHEILSRAGPSWIDEADEVKEWLAQRGAAP